MSRYFRSMILLCALALPGLALAARYVPLDIPQPIAVPAGMKDNAVSAAIVAAIRSKGWAVPFERRGYVEALMQRKALRVHVGFLYDAKQIRMVYLDNHGFHFHHDEDVPAVILVHKKFNNWLRQINESVTLSLTNPAALPKPPLAAGQEDAGAEPEEAEAQLAKP